MPKVLVTSCNSYLGFSITNLLINEGYIVVGTYRKNNDRIHQLTLLGDDKIKLFQIDLSNPEDFNKMPNDINYVVHNSAAFPWYDVSNEEVIQCNVNGTLYLSNWLNKNVTQLKKLILLSSLSVYGDIHKELLTESNQLASNDIYGVTKNLSEIIIRDILVLDKKYTIRLPVVLGNGAHRAWIPEIVKKLMKNEEVQIFNSLEPYNSLTTDLALGRFVHRLIVDEHNENNLVVNIGSKNSLKVIEIVEILKKSLQSKSVINVQETNNITYQIDSTLAEKMQYKTPAVIDALEYYIKESEFQRDVACQ